MGPAAQWGQVSPLFIISYIYLMHLTSTNEAQIIFKTGKNYDGFFNTNNLLQQVNNAIDIFKGLTNGWAQALFLFNNVPSHQKYAMEAILARNMVKDAPALSVSHHHPFALARP